MSVISMRPLPTSFLSPLVDRALGRPSSRRMSFSSPVALLCRATGTPGAGRDERKIFSASLDAGRALNAERSAWSRPKLERREQDYDGDGDYLDHRNSHAREIRSRHLSGLQIGGELIKCPSLASCGAAPRSPAFELVAESAGPTAVTLACRRCRR